MFVDCPTARTGGRIIVDPAMQLWDRSTGVVQTSPANNSSSRRVSSSTRFIQRTEPASNDAGPTGASRGRLLQASAQPCWTSHGIEWIAALRCPGYCGNAMRRGAPMLPTARPVGLGLSVLVPLAVINSFLVTRGIAAEGSRRSATRSWPRWLGVACACLQSGPFGGRATICPAYPLSPHRIILLFQS